jgi:hypothetical protein
MAVSVNPPPQLKIPKAFLEDREVRAFIQQQNTILFQLYNRSGGNNDAVSNLENFSTSGFSSEVQFLQQQLNGLPELTIDSSGFTVDTTFITTDKVIA